MIRIYRAALRILPRAVRERHGQDMAAVFADLLADARRRGAASAIRALLAEVGALVWFVVCEHRGRPLPPRIDERMLVWSTNPEGRRPMFSSLTQDARYAGRMLWRTPGFTAVCVATMALAIGANTALFSVVHGVLLKPLPYADPERVVVLGNRTDGGMALDATTPRRPATSTTGRPAPPRSLPWRASRTGSRS